MTPKSQDHLAIFKKRMYFSPKKIFSLNQRISSGHSYIFVHFFCCRCWTDCSVSIFIALFSLECVFSAHSGKNLHPYIWARVHILKNNSFENNRCFLPPRLLFSVLPSLKYALLRSILTIQLEEKDLGILVTQRLNIKQLRCN